MTERRIASHPDDPTAPLADRLLLALGMWPKYAEELGVDAVLDAAVSFRTAAHLFPMVQEDYGTVADERDCYRTAVKQISELLPGHEYLATGISLAALTEPEE